jgi:hypothetical protein
VYLKDVWMSVLCPVYKDAVWFLQFWAKGLKNRDGLGHVEKRVGGRLSGHPGLVEDLFTVRFNEMIGITRGGKKPSTHAARANVPMQGREFGSNRGEGSKNGSRAEENVAGAHRRPKWVSHCAQADSGRAQDAQALLRHAHPRLRYAHPQLRLKQPLLTSAD